MIPPRLIEKLRIEKLLYCNHGRFSLFLQDVVKRKGWQVTSFLDFLPNILVFI